MHTILQLCRPQQKIWLPTSPEATAGPQCMQMCRTGVCGVGVSEARGGEQGCRSTLLPAQEAPAPEEPSRVMVQRL